MLATRRMLGYAAAIALACLAVLTFGSRPASAAKPVYRAQLGVYEGSGAPAYVQRFARWLGRTPAFVVDFLQRDTWEAISRPTWWAESWQGAPYRLVYAVPMLPESGASLADGARGTYDVYFERIAREFVAHGQADALIRLGWEFNGDWFSWSAYRDPSAFVRYWRRVVNAMRSVPGARFQFEWSPVYGQSKIDAELVYPGDAWVDVIGLSLFDASWYPGGDDPETRWGHLLAYPYGLLWHRDFAALHRKPVSYPEWGMLLRKDGFGGGDNPYFIERMHAWLAANRGEVLYHAYFDHADEATLSLPDAVYPRGAARFRELFRKPFPKGRGDGVGQLLVEQISGAPGVGVRVKGVRGSASLASGRRIDIFVRASVPRGLRRVVVRVDGRIVCTFDREPLTCRTAALAPGRHVVVASVTDEEGWSGWGGTEVKIGRG